MIEAVEAATRALGPSLDLSVEALSDPEFRSTRLVLLQKSDDDSYLVALDMGRARNCRLVGGEAILKSRTCASDPGNVGTIAVRACPASEDEIALHKGVLALLSCVYGGVGPGSGLTVIRLERD